MSFKKIAVAVSVVAASLLGADYAPSTTAPVSNPPQFIVLGSDDNTDPEALRWMVDVLNKYTNKDGSKLRMSFYSNTKEGAWTGADAPIALAHKYAYQNGHEVSNHTETHIACIDGNTRVGKPEILAQMQTASDRLANMAGIPKAHQFGFRTPYLKYSDSTFTAMKEFGFLYDCSISEGNQQATGKTENGAGEFFWPYTLATANSANQSTDLFKNGGEYFRPSWDTTTEYYRDMSYAPGAHVRWSYHNKTNVAAVRQHSGLWELPCYNLNASSKDYVPSSMTWESASQEIGGLDYNMWANAPAGYELNAQQSLDVMKHTLDEMYNGNRTPMTLGLHSQYYFQSDEPAVDDDGNVIPGKYVFPNIRSAVDRKWMLEEFVKYAVAKSDVWFVSGDMVIRYMQDSNPPAASSYNPADYAVIPVDTTGDDTTGNDTTVAGDPVEVINLASYYGAYHDSADADASSSAVLDSTADTTSKVTISLATGASWASAEAAFDSAFTKVTHVEVAYSATEDYKMLLPMSSTGGNGSAHFVTLSKSETSKKVAVGDFKQPTWATDTLKKKLELSGVKTIGFELAEGVASGNLELTSIVLYGYPKPEEDTTGNDTGSTDGDIDLLGSDVSWYSFYDTANGATVTLDSANAAFAGATIDLSPDGTYAGLAPWISENFKMDSMKRVTITYTSDVDFEMTLPMPGVTSDNGEAHKITLPASDQPNTVEVGLLDFKQPDWVAVEDSDNLDLSVVEAINLALVSDIQAGAITITEMKLLATGDAVAVETTMKKSFNAPVFAGIANNKMSLAVPSAGRYGITLYSLKGQKLGHVSADLTAGMNAVSMNGISLGRQMMIVQISGNGINSVHKAMVK